MWKIWMYNQEGRVLSYLPNLAKEEAFELARPAMFLKDHYIVSTVDDLKYIVITKFAKE